MGNGSTALENAASDALSTGGKRVGRTLALLWCELYSGDYRPAIPLAATYELAHASALVPQLNKLGTGLVWLTGLYSSYLDSSALGPDIPT